MSTQILTIDSIVQKTQIGTCLLLDKLKYVTKKKEKKEKNLSKESLTVRRRIATDDHRTFTVNLNGTASFSTKLIALDSFR